MLIIKQGFKFLDAFSFGSQYKGMLSACQGNEIDRAVIAFNPIQVMPNFVRFQRASQLLFQYENMFKDKSHFISSRMLRFFNKNIPVWRLVSMLGVENSWVRFTTYFHCTTMAPCSISGNQFSAIYARVKFALPEPLISYFASTLPRRAIFFPPIFSTTPSASFTFPCYQSITAKTGVHIFAFIFTLIFSLIHNTNYTTYNYKLQERRCNGDTYTKRDNYITELYLQNKLKELGID